MMDSPDSSRPLPQDRVRTSESVGKGSGIDPAASAALAEAIRSARQGAKPASTAEPTPPEAPHDVKTLKSPLIPQAVAAFLLIGMGWLASYMGTLANRDAIHRMEAETARSQDILAKLTDDLAALKNTMSTYQDVERTSSTAAVSDQARMVEKVERLAIAIQDPTKKLSSLEDRLERMEGQIIAALNTNKTTAANNEPENASPVKQVVTEPVDGWILREVYNGSALVESRNRSLYEVMPGSVIPGAGRVEAIERRGARWVVVTDKGFIGNYR